MPGLFYVKKTLTNVDGRISYAYANQHEHQMEGNRMKDGKASILLENLVDELLARFEFDTVEEILKESQFSDDDMYDLGLYND